MRTKAPSSVRKQEKHMDKGLALYSEKLTLFPALTKILKNLDTISESDDLKIYKRERRKAVLLMKRPDNEGGSLVIKGFPLMKFSNQIRPGRFGQMEAHNMLQAEQHGIKSPRYLGFFEFRKFGLTKANGVIMEPLGSHKTLMEFAEENSADAEKAFNLAIPTIAKLYRLGTNHIDVSPHNIMAENLDDLPYLIDWQACRFIGPKNDRQLILQGAQFLRYLNNVFPLASQKEWLSTLYRTVNPEISEELFLKNSIHYAHQPRPSHEFRYRLDFDLNQVQTS